MRDNETQDHLLSNVDGRFELRAPHGESKDPGDAFFLGPVPAERVDRARGDDMKGAVAILAGLGALWLPAAHAAGAFTRLTPHCTSSVVGSLGAAAEAVIAS